MPKHNPRPAKPVKPRLMWMNDRNDVAFYSRKEAALDAKDQSSSRPVLVLDLSPESVEANHAAALKKCKIAHGGLFSAHGSIVESCINVYAKSLGIVARRPGRGGGK